MSQADWADLAEVGEEEGGGDVQLLKSVYPWLESRLPVFTP
jgi:hypothetical protein